MNSAPLLTAKPADPSAALLNLVRPEMEQVHARLTELAAVDDAVLAPMLSTVLPGSGKRMRPALALLIGKLGTPSAEAMRQMAIGVELLHTASLVHDDVVDDSEMRRGAATLFTKVGNALAVLVGDYLFSLAAQACVSTGNLRVVQLFARTLGAMAQGQVDEANAQKAGRSWQRVDLDRYYRTIWNKTASLFVLACEGAAILADLPERQIHALRTYGDRLGLAFQVVDDILDFTSTTEALGKSVANDLRQGIATLPVILLRDGGLSNGQFNDVFESGDVEAQIQLVQESGAIRASYQEAERLVAEALEALEALPVGVEREALANLATFALKRTG